jgi:hypothetical protein
VTTSTLRRAIVAIATLTAAIVGVTTSTATAADFTVRPGSTTTVFGPVVNEFELRQPRVDPSTAGTLTIVQDLDAGTEEVVFVAATSYNGEATLSFGLDGQLQTLTVEIDGSQSDISATFTPRPAPGPCIAVALVDPNDPTGPAPSGVGFGDVQVGATAVSPTTINVSSCTTGNLTQFISAQVGDATSGSGPGQVVWEPGTTTGFGLGPNEFQYAVRLPALPDPIALRNDLVGIATFASASSPPLPVQSELTVGPGSSTGLGEQFSTTVTFVATT